MGELAEFHFLRPWWLLLALPAFALWWMERREFDTTVRWRAVMDATLLAHLTVGGGKRWISPGDVLLAAWIVCALAVAGLTWQQVASPFAQTARPAMFVLKVTPSMLGRDVAPTRLDRAREKMADLLKLREGAPTGLVAYAGSAHLVLPPTPDAAVIITMAGALAPGIMPRSGDALADAVKLAQEALAGGGQGGSIVVFADTAPPIKEGGRGEASVFLYATLPADRAPADPALRAAVAVLDAALIAPTIDTADVETLAGKLAAAGRPPSASGEAPRWEEAGWWLTPLIGLSVLAWFRRGWVLT